MFLSTIGGGHTAILRQASSGLHDVPKEAAPQESYVPGLRDGAREVLFKAYQNRGWLALATGAAGLLGYAVTGDPLVGLTGAVVGAGFATW